MNIYYKIFISYTLRDEKISYDLLFRLKNILSNISTIETFIDVIDNKNIISPQEEVFYKLKSADAVWVINSYNLNQSKWVLSELALAKELMKPIYYIEFPQVLRLVEIGDLNKLKKHVNKYLPVRDKIAAPTKIEYNLNLRG